MESYWGRVYRAVFLKGGNCIQQKENGKEGRLKVEDVITFLPNIGSKVISGLVAQVSREKDILKIRTTGGIYEFKIL